MGQCRKQLLKERNHKFLRPTKPVVYCYEAFQPTTFTRMKKEQGIQLYIEISSSELSDKWYVKSRGGIMVLDDLMDQGSNDQRILDLFTRLPSSKYHRHPHVKRPNLGMRIKSMPLKIPEIKWEYAISPNRSKMY